MKSLNDKNKQGFTLTRDDFQWQYFCSGTKGGQKQNKTASACRCVHPPSKSAGISRDERSQTQNRRLAFSRCVHSKEFSNWVKVEISRLGAKEMKRPELDLMIRPDNTLVEVHDEAGNWVPDSP